MKSKFSIGLVYILIGILSSSCQKYINILSNQTQPYTVIDSRCIENGIGIKSSKYIDQPYCVKLFNNSWLCTYTLSDSFEASRDQRVGVALSDNLGKTWTETTNNLDTFLCNYSLPFVTSFGRVYIFYTFNNTGTFFTNSHIYEQFLYGGVLGFKYSDDNGLTWSARQVVNLPKTYIDYVNVYKGTFQTWWSICKPIIANGQMYFSLTKTAAKYEEGHIVGCSNILTETDPLKLDWHFYPTGNDLSKVIGIRNNSLSDTVLQEEHNIQQLNRGGYVCAYRTTLGFPMITYSRNATPDNWEVPTAFLYSNGDSIRNPRACPRIFKCSNGKYLFWHHANSFNSGHRYVGWISGGIEKDGSILWSQPEVALFSNSESASLLMSYPDLIESGGKYYITETQKKVARINEISAKLLDNLWNQDSLNSEILNGRLLKLQGSSLDKSAVKNIAIPSFYPTTGYCVQLKLNLTAYSDKTPKTYLMMYGKNMQDTVFRIKRYGSRVFAAELLSNNKVVCSIFSGNENVNLDKAVVLSFNVDKYAKVFSGMINGVLFRGNQTTLQGWSRIVQSMNQTYLFNNVISVDNTDNTINQLSIYSRYLTTSEQVSNYKYLITR